MSLKSMKKVIIARRRVCLEVGTGFLKCEYDVCEFTFLNGGFAHVFQTSIADP
jgi:hypothetical protein